MGTKRINELSETTTPLGTSEMVLETQTGFTLKAKISNILKRIFSFDDVWDDYTVSGIDLEHAGGNTAPTFKQFNNNFYLHAFEDGAQINEGFFSIHMNHDMKANTNMNFHIHWTHNEAAPSGDVKWNIEYTIAKGYSKGTYASPKTANATQTAAPQYTHHITDDDDMVVIGTNNEMEPDTVLIGRIYRDPTDIEDTFAGDAFLINVDLHYVKSRTGTTERNAPYTSGEFV